LAQLAIKQGEKNIAQPSDEHDHSYKPVDARNPDGSLDHFLFSYRNYPYGALTQGSPASRVWSSSTSSKESNPETSYFYALRDGEGFFVPDKKDNQYTVFLRQIAISSIFCTQCPAADQPLAIGCKGAQIVADPRLSALSGS
jgi:hypothetical protein